ncbi:hypothetical protein [Bifidobacterium panos]|uniref:Condensation domain-containing protein n=1 Tax=Bifidobacterium panos TaxID=2675321 RepID=A0ABX1SW28_9BIFI|nr:hypothetical protein [Bifidobacterium sp. DSM 109963]NMN01555.1 hypothetical protein [Bifidobacterium sp. DSM 109963]
MTRKYLTSERAALFEPNAYISMLVTLEGDLEPERIERAVNAAYAANESTMSRIVLEADGSAYYDRLKVSGCRVSVDERDMQTVLHESEKKPFALMNGELVRTFILPGNDTTALFIHAHNLAGDGLSMLILISDMLDALSGATLTYKPMRLADRSFLEGKAQLPMLTRLYTKRVNRQWEKTGRTFGWDDYQAVHERYWKHHATHFEITTHSVRDLKAHCAPGTTITDLLVTDLLKDNPQCRNIGIPISIREAEDCGMSNMVSAIPLSHEYDARKTFDENLRMVHQEIRKYLAITQMKYFVLLFVMELSPSLVDSVLLQTHGCFDGKVSAQLAEAIGCTDKNMRDLGITNLGNIDIETQRGDFAVRDILFIPPNVSYTRQVFGAASLGDTLTLCRSNA